MPKKVTTDDLAKMVAKGFNSIESKMASKDDLKAFATKEDLLKETSAIRDDIENLELRMGHLAYAFDVKDLKKRMVVVERKLGVK